ncbi:MAG: amino acid adenylation domain-containing protein [Terracidiphilus sp.]|jgi:amino acid adenylation domain-containing protein
MNSTSGLALSRDEEERLFALLLEDEGVFNEELDEAIDRTDTTTGPLSFTQEAMWFLSELAPESTYYNVPITLKLRGCVNHAILERAMRSLVERHEVLRTCFICDSSVPEQVIGTAELKLSLVDLTRLQRDAQEAEIRAFAVRELASHFNLATGPLLRAHLLRLSGDEHVLVLTMHHIISDAWSNAIILRELGAAYDALAEGRALPFEPAPMRFIDYAQWQRKCMTGDHLDQLLAHWKQQLGGAEQNLALPFDYPRPAIQRHIGGRETMTIEAELAEKLRSLAQTEGVTLFMLLLAVFSVLLSRYSNQRDIIVAAPTSGRDRTDLEQLVGPLINTLLLRTSLEGDPTFRDLVRRVRNLTLDAFSHQELPFEKLVEALQPHRDLAVNPLFQVMFDLQKATQTIDASTRFTMEHLDVDNTIEKFDLTLWIDDLGADLRFRLSYNRDLFENSTARRMLRHFRRLIEAVTEDATTRISQLPLMTDVEREQMLLGGWNDTETEYPSDKCIHQLFEEQELKSPDAIAVVFEDESLSYSELNGRANQLAHYLRKLGVKPDACVAVCVERSFEMVVALMAVLKAGGAYVPLDPAYPVERLRFMLEDCAPAALLTQSHLGGLFSGSGNGLPVIDLTATSAWQDLPSTNPAYDGFGLTPDHLAYVIYTSGSTGNPKGVLVHHRGVVNRLVWMQRAYELDASEAVLQKTPYSFDVSVWEFFWTLSVGARLVMARPEGHKNPAYLIAAMQQNKITTIHFVPTMLQVFLEDRDAFSIPSLARVVCSGEALSAQLLQRFRERFPNAALHNLYGPTEAAVDVTAWSCPADFNQSVVPIGKPIANTRIYILDSDGQPVPVGVIGELYIAGVQVARGYLNRPELTAEKFLADHFAADADARMYRTGDLGRWLADGNIEFLGRNDFQVKIRGLRIELGEIEARLMECSAIREAVVIAREDTPGDMRLVAYYTGTEEQGEFGAEQFRSHLSASLPEHMVPAAYVRLQSLPMTPSGKLNRKALPAPKAGAYSTCLYESPQGEIEIKLAALWAEVLKLERIGRHDNFFELGGHSLLAIRLIARVREAIQIELSLAAVFEYPTLHRFAEHAETLLWIAKGRVKKTSNGSMREQTEL